MVFLRLLSFLPFPVLYALSDVLFFLAYYVVRYRRKLVAKNLSNAFPGTSREELLSIEKAFYSNLCDYAVETLKLLTIPREELCRRMRFVNPEVVEEQRSRQESLIVLASHQFNWEWLLASASASLPLPADFVYQRVRNKLFNEFSLRSRSRFGAFPVLRQEVAREAFKRRHLVRMIALVSDQYPGYRHDKKYPVKFMGQETVFFEGVSQLAILTQLPVVFTEVRKVRRGYYEVTFVPIARPPYARGENKIIEAYAAAVEKVIRNNPDGWLWSHNRWKKRHVAAG